MGWCCRGYKIFYSVSIGCIGPEQMGKEYKEMKGQLDNVEFVWEMTIQRVYTYVCV